MTAALWKRGTDLRTTRTFQQNKTVHINELKCAVQVSVFGLIRNIFICFKEMNKNYSGWDFWYSD